MLRPLAVNLPLLLLLGLILMVGYVAAIYALDGKNLRREGLEALSMHRRTRATGPTRSA